MGRGSPRIVVLGAGMAGLLAAKGVNDTLGIKPTIVAMRQPKKMTPGSMGRVLVLHEACGMALRPKRILNMVNMPDVGVVPMSEMSDFELKMANSSYAEQVYGSRKVTTSLLRMEPVIMGFDFVMAFNTLLEDFKECVTTTRGIAEPQFLAMCEDNDLVISTIPRRCITPPWVRHDFETVWVAPAPPIDLDYSSFSADNRIIYNAETGKGWSRTARLIGKTGRGQWYTEYPSMPKSPKKMESQIKVSGCETYTFPENALLTGRMGKWEPGVLAHQAYWDAVQSTLRWAD